MNVIQSIMMSRLQVSKLWVRSSELLCDMRDE